MRKPKFKIHGHQTERQQARIMARVLQPSPMRVSLLPGQQAGWIPGRVNNDYLVCSFVKNIFIMDNFKQVQSKQNSVVNTCHSAFTITNTLSSFPPFIPPLAFHSVFHRSFSGMVANLLPSRGTNLSCSTVTEEYVCAAHTSCHSAQSRLPLQVPMPMPSQSPALPAPRSTSSFSHLTFPQVSFASSGIVLQWNHPEGTFFRVRFVSLTSFV